jgi:hypothetical protein
VEGADMPRETTYIPVEGPMAFLGAACYLAVLAYPADIRNRNLLVKVIKAIHVNNNWERLSEESKRKKNIYLLPSSLIDKTMTRFLKKLKDRIKAAWIVQSRLVHGMVIGPYEKIGPYLRNAYLKIEVFASYETKMAAPCREDPSRVICQKVKKPASVNALAKQILSESKKHYGYGSEKNIITRIWTPSKPVLHLALVFKYLTDKPEFLWGENEYRFLYNPAWVKKAVIGAEAFRKALIDKKIVTEQETIQLLPS